LLLAPLNTQPQHQPLAHHEHRSGTSRVFWKDNSQLANHTLIEITTPLLNKELPLPHKRNTLVLFYRNKYAKKIYEIFLIGLPINNSISLASPRYMGSGLHAETGCRKVYAGEYLSDKKIP